MQLSPNSTNVLRGILFTLLLAICTMHSTFAQTTTLKVSVEYDSEFESSFNAYYGAAHNYNINNFFESLFEVEVSGIYNDLDVVLDFHPSRIVKDITKNATSITGCSDCNNLNAPHVDEFKFIKCYKKSWSAGTVLRPAGAISNEPVPLSQLGHDLVVVFTGRVPFGNSSTNGKADANGALCGIGDAANIAACTFNQDIYPIAFVLFQSNLTVMKRLLAHEVGHILGGEHMHGGVMFQSAQSSSLAIETDFKNAVSAHLTEAANCIPPCFFPSSNPFSITSNPVAPGASTFVEAQQRYIDNVPSNGYQWEFVSGGQHFNIVGQGGIKANISVNSGTPNGAYTIKCTVTCGDGAVKEYLGTIQVATPSCSLPSFNPLSIGPSPVDPGAYISVQAQDRFPASANSYQFDILNGGSNFNITPHGGIKASIYVKPGTPGGTYIIRCTVQGCSNTVTQEYTGTVQVSGSGGGGGGGPIMMQHRSTSQLAIKFDRTIEQADGQASIGSEVAEKPSTNLSYTVKIYDLFGQERKKFTSVRDNQRLDIHSLEKGLYIMHILDHDGAIHVMKFLNY